MPDKTTRLKKGERRESKKKQKQRGYVGGGDLQIFIKLIIFLLFLFKK